MGKGLTKVCRAQQSTAEPELALRNLPLLLPSPLPATLLESCPLSVPTSPLHTRSSACSVQKLPALPPRAYVAHTSCLDPSLCSTSPSLLPETPSPLAPQFFPSGPLKHQGHQNHPRPYAHKHTLPCACMLTRTITESRLEFHAAGPCHPAASTVVAHCPLGRDVNEWRLRNTAPRPA